MNCPICNNKKRYSLYRQLNIPLFQNVVYSNAENARTASTASVELAQCSSCGFVYNQSFDANILDYQADYQNEQSYSPYFEQHLENVYNVLKNKEVIEKKIIEIGCGKGYFLEYLRNKNIDIIGFDPAYEGSNPLIIKEYFTKSSTINAELIILRHTLEHIFKPYNFIKTISEANYNRGIIYIEVPTFDWIVKNNAIEDIFYEHCNYFTPSTLANMFVRSETGLLFNGQYFYLIAQLSDLKSNFEKFKQEKKQTKVCFESKIEKYKRLFIGKSKNIAIWGAGAKGNTFLNLMDKNREFFECVIDINPRKQGKYIGGTGHPIIAPSQIDKNSIKTIVIMNSNYFDEIRSSVNSNIELIKLY